MGGESFIYTQCVIKTACFENMKFVYALVLASLLCSFADARHRSRTTASPSRASGSRRVSPPAVPSGGDRPSTPIVIQQAPAPDMQQSPAPVSTQPSSSSRSLESRPSSRGRSPASRPSSRGRTGPTNSGSRTAQSTLLSVTGSRRGRG